MERQIMTLNEIRQIGMDALFKALGPVGMVRFLQQFDMGKGDYTKEREQWLGNLTVETILKEIDEMSKKSPR